MDWTTKKRLLIWQRQLSRHFMKSIYKPIVKVTDSSYLDQKQIKKLAEHIQAFLVAETKARR
jgi:indole-3-glycerol phosphate synthase